MSCFLTRNIKHTCEYNAGGIASILLLDIRDFISYTFRGDRLYTECYVEQIITASGCIELSSVDESNFTESQDNGIFKQELTTFIRSLEAEKLSSLLTAGNNKYLVIFKTFQGKAFSFGSDGGASLSFTQQTGQAGEVSGYNITLSKNSVYPLFETSGDIRILEEEEDINGYIRGEEGQVWYRMQTTPNGYYANGWINDYDFDKSREEWINNRSVFRTRDNTDIKKNSNCETIKTIMIDKGEYEWLTKSICFDYGDGNNNDPSFQKYCGYTEDDVKNRSGFIQRPDLTVYDIQKHIGGWGYYNPSTTNTTGISEWFQNNQGILWKVFRNSYTGVEESKEWYMADDSDYLYLLGIMPSLTGNFHQDAMDFLCMSADEDKLNLAVPLTRRKNISGVNFAPLGRRENGDGRNPTPIYSYPSDCAFLTNSLKAFIISWNGWLGKGSGVYMSAGTTTAHGAQVRYCRRVPDNKLGYKLIYNTTTDKVNFVSPDWGSQWFQENIIPYNANMNQIPGSWNGQANYNGFIYLNQSAIQGKHISRLDNIKLRFYPETGTSGTLTIWKSTDNHGQNVIWEREYIVNGVSDGTSSLDVDIDLGEGEFIGFGKSTDNTRLWFSATGLNTVAGGFYVRAYGNETTWDLGIGISIGEPSNIKPSDQDVIPRGLERGVAMRYATIDQINKLNSVVSKKWSEIQAEASERMSKINIV